MSLISEMIQFAQKNGGVFSIQDAAAIGMSGKMLRSRVEDGVFIRVGRGVLALPGASTRPDLVITAACYSLGAVVSHDSAARYHQLEPIAEGLPTVTVPHRTTHTFPGVVVHQTTDLLESHLVEAAHYRVTDPERTIVDIARTMKRWRLERVMDNGLARGIIDAERLYDMNQALARRGKAGPPLLRRLLENRMGEPPLTDSELERLVLRVLREGGLPQPATQFKADWLRPIDGRVDFAYIDHKLVIEADSRRWHLLLDSFETDRHRDNAATLAGWRVLRFTWRMLVDEPDQVVAIVRAALAQETSTSTHS